MNGQYLLDDDIEYYNQAEPVTTKCPLLPGQPLNVLNVPVILPDSRHGRSSSNSSQKSDYRTMNPEDKFMNPRKPPKPDLTRLQTSACNQQTFRSHTRNLSPTRGTANRSASQPSNASSRIHSPKGARSVSPPRSRGAHSPRYKRLGPWTRLDASNGELPSRLDDKIPAVSVNPGTASSFSAERRENSPPATLQSRRALRLNGMNGPHTRNLLTVETRTQHRKLSISETGAVASNLVTVDERTVVKDALAYPSLESSADLTTPTGLDMKEKRLPTLPNTPSSVMDEAVRAIDETDQAMNLEVLRSHFSSLTTVGDPTNSCFMVERSRFSEWSTDTGDNSPESMISTSAFDPVNVSPALDDWKTPELSQATDAATITDPNTPHLTVHSKPSSPNSASGNIPSWLPQLTISLSSPLFDGMGLGIEEMDEVESNPKRHAALFSALESMEGLSLSQDPNGSPILLQHPQHPSDTRSSDVSSSGKATMQELMDELSYLRNMIQAEMDGEPF